MSNQSRLKSVSYFKFLRRKLRKARISRKEDWIFLGNNILIDLNKSQSIIVTEYWNKNLPFIYKDERAIEEDQFIEALKDGTENLVQIKSLDITDAKELQFVFIEQLAKRYKGKLYCEIIKHRYYNRSLLADRPPCRVCKRKYVSKNNDFEPFVNYKVIN